MIPTREPIPTYSPSNLLAYYMEYMWQIFHSPDKLFCNGVYNSYKMVGSKYTEYKGLPADSQTITFYISIKFIVAFHVNTMQPLHLPVNSIINKHETTPSKTFQSI